MMDSTNTRVSNGFFRRLFTGITDVNPNTLTIGQLKFIERSLDSCPVYLSWVTVVDKKTNRAGDTSLVAVGKYRLLLLARSTLGKKKPDVNAHLYDLRQALTFNVNEVCLKFSKHDLTLQAPNVGDELTPVLETCARRIAVNFPASEVPSFTYEPPSRAFELPALELGFDHGFLETYRAYCSFYNLLSSPSFVHYVESLDAASRNGGASRHGSLRLAFHDCAGISPKSDLTFDLLPVAFALRFAACFYSVSMKLVPRKDFVAALSIALRYNESITKLVLCATGSESTGFVELGHALKENHVNRITHLEIERSEVRDVGAVAISQAIMAKKFGLVTLILRDCGIQPKGMAELFRALHTNSGVSTSIACLDVSDNECGTLGTAHLSDWLYGMRADPMRPGGFASSLKRLCLASCQLGTSEALQAIRAALLDRLKHLDLSCNRFSRDAAQALLDFLGQTRALIDLTVVNCHLSPELLQSVMSTLRGNPAVGTIKLNIGDNDVGIAGARLLSKEIRLLHTLRTLRMAGCDLRCEGMVEIIKAVGNSKIVSVDLSDNTKKMQGELIAALCELLSRPESELRKLRFARNGLGEQGLAVLSALASNSQQLAVLDVSGNKLGNHAAVLLARLLLHASTLVKLAYDDNEIGLSGWQALAESLRQNRSLCDLPEPVKDIARAVSSKLNREQVVQVMQRISQSLKENRASRQAVKSPKSKRQHTRKPSLV